MKTQINWQQFFISILGTAIGIALTFGLNGLRNQKIQKADQRLTAIMVIHDIDESIEILKSRKEQEEKTGKLLEYVLTQKDSLDRMSYDSLSTAASSLLTSSMEFRFDTSKEKIFNSDLDTWQNLGNMKFIDNVQSFFFDRQSFQEWYNTDALWVGPVSREDYMQLFMGIGWMTEERVAEILRPFLKEKLEDKRVSYYIDVASYRMQELNSLIDSWTALNDDNKFLMGITDQELVDYVNNMRVTGLRVTKRNLAGTWTMIMEDNSGSRYTFGRDHSCSIVSNTTTDGRWEFWSGSFKAQATYYGKWEMKGDSLIVSIDPLTCRVDVDGSELVPVEGKQDSLDVWLKEYRENALTAIRERPDEENRYAFQARVDSSNDKMKWSDADESVFFLKRNR